MPHDMHLRPSCGRLATILLPTSEVGHFFDAGSTSYVLRFADSWFARVFTPVLTVRVTR